MNIFRKENGVLVLSRVVEDRTKNRKVRCPREVIQVTTKEGKVGTNLPRGLKITLLRSGDAEMEIFQCKRQKSGARRNGHIPLQIPCWTRNFTEHRQAETYISSSTPHTGCFSVLHSCLTFVRESLVPCRFRHFR